MTSVGVKVLGPLVSFVHPLTVENSKFKVELVILTTEFLQIRSSNIDFRWIVK